MELFFSIEPDYFKPVRCRVRIDPLSMNSVLLRPQGFHRVNVTDAVSLGKNCEQADYEHTNEAGKKQPYGKIDPIRIFF